MRARLIVLFALALVLFGAPCSAALFPPPPEPLQAPPLSVRMEYALPPQPAAAGERLLIAVLEPHTGYTTYAHHSGASRPTLAGLFASGRPLATTVLYPAGTLHKDVLSGKDVASYTAPTPVFLRLPPGLADSGALTLSVSLLLCSTANCIPVDVTLPLPPLPPPAALPLVSATPWAKDWENAAPGSSLTAPPAAVLSTPPLAALPVLPLPGAAPATPPAAVSPAAIPVTIPVAPSWQFTPRPASMAADPASLGMAMFWGVLAGLILNIMPCVLPVLTLKMFALLGPAAAAGAGSGHDRERIRLFREHNVLFAGGVLTWFALLACAVSLLGLTWGGLFQYPAVVAGLAVLVGLLGLSMLDLCTLPVIDLKLDRAPSRKATGSPRVQAYLTGLTATLLATPCSGPLLGGVLAWSAAQPPAVVLLVFLSTGLGMALPYLVFAVWPSAVSLLPRPGKWLLVLERCLGFFLLATTSYLLSILPRTSALVLAAVLLLLAIGLVLRRARRRDDSPITALAVALGCGLLALWVLHGPLETARRAASDQAVWETFTPELFAAALGRSPILLEFTADWCPNCKLLELTTLSPDRLNDWKRRYNLRLIRVDMTSRDPAREALLRALGSISIPLTALFPAGAAAHSPLVLRDVYSPAHLDHALSVLEHP